MIGTYLLVGCRKTFALATALEMVVKHIRHYTKPWVSLFWC